MIRLQKYRDPWMAESLNKFIGFYQREFYPLDNFSAFKIDYDGYIYSTVEEAYQAIGFIDTAPEIYDRIIHCPSAHEAKQIAHQYAQLRRKDWEEVKLKLMENLLRAKAEQHIYVRKKLLETGNYILCEDSPEDYFWGIGADRTGLNHLGRIWMKIRNEIQPVNNTIENIIKENWEYIIDKTALISKASDIARKTWLEPIKFISYDENVILISFPVDNIGVSYYYKTYAKSMADVIHELCSINVTIKIQNDLT